MRPTCQSCSTMRPPATWTASGHALPASDLLGAVDAGCRDIALAFRRDLRRFGDDQPCACALSVIERVERGRHVAGAGAAPRQGRHDDAVGALQRSDLDRGEQVRPGLGGAVLHGKSPERQGEGALRRSCPRGNASVHAGGIAKTGQRAAYPSLSPNRHVAG